MTTIEINLCFPKLPTVTAQQKGMKIVHGKPMYYEKKRVTEARELFAWKLKPFAPAEPISGAVRLTVEWFFYSKSHKPNTWRITRPDTDNLQKLLKDTMTDCGFWKDDAQVCWETAMKKWTSAGAETLKIRIDELESYYD